MICGFDFAIIVQRSVYRICSFYESIGSGARYTRTFCTACTFEMRVYFLCELPMDRTNNIHLILDSGIRFFLILKSISVDDSSALYNFFKCESVPSITTRAPTSFEMVFRSLFEHTVFRAFYTNFCIPIDIYCPSITVLLAMFKNGAIYEVVLCKSSGGSHEDYL